ncbi:MAG TPA: aminoacyl-tRNA hydrolase [Acidimicrobiia bacterium]|jgi:PTH1 family peptidyl-tRNA hydrolase
MLRGRGERTERTGTPVDLLVVGLGNPGEEFRHTRHNVGADAVDILARRHGARLKVDRRTRAVHDTVTVGGRRMLLAIPTTYMNESGAAVAPLLRRAGVDAEHLLVVHDELDLPLAAMKLKAGGGLAGNNGLRSIKASLKTDTFLRVRIGIGKPVSKERGADHVLSRFAKRDRTEIDVTLELAADAVECILADGIDVAMNRFNTRSPD